MKRFACVTCQGVFDGPAHFHGEAGPFCATHVLESLAKVEVSVALFPPAGQAVEAKDTLPTKEKNKKKSIFGSAMEWVDKKK